jgi:phospholipase D1/2
MPKDERDTAIPEIDRGTRSDDSSSAFDGLDGSAVDRASSHGKEPRIRHANVRFEPGRNCWRVEPAQRAAFLIDGEEYFSAFREAALSAQRSIYILGWDFDTRIRMMIGRESDRDPDRLGPFLDALLMRRKRLHIYVLVWDFHVIYFKERQWWLPTRLLAHRRLHFWKDGTHPVGASQHQKVVVVDDAVAFVGGFDFAQCRWDTPEHRMDHPDRRMLSDGASCRPFHDVQMLVDGDAAAALGRLARARWEAATGEQPPAPPSDRVNDPWPVSVAPDLREIQVAIARTMPAAADQPPVREVERLLIDLLQAARRCIYIETQYFTSKVLAETLADLLQREDGPDIVMILHPSSDGWLEQHTMDVLRGRVLKHLRTVDRHHRLALYYPHVPDAKERCISVHSKVCVIDDTYVRVGSANLSNRSLGFDTECDLAVQASGDPKVESSIAAFRNRLLGEHLDVSPEEVAQALRRHSRLIAAVEALRGRDRTLEVFDRNIPPEVDELVPDDEFIDPSGPYEMQLCPPENRSSVHRQMVMGVTVLLIVAGLAAAWRWSPLGEWMELSRLMAYAEEFERSPMAPFVIVGSFVMGGLVVAPVTVLVTVTVLAFGPLHGFVYSLLGMTLSAMVTFGLGRLMGRQLVERWSARLYRLSRNLATKGVLAVVAVRVIPVAPFTVVNMIAGATHIRTKDFLLGTILGELPGLLAIAVFVDQVTTTLHSPGLGSYLVLAGSAIVLVGAVWGLRRWLSRRANFSNDKA